MNKKEFIERFVKRLIERHDKFFRDTAVAFWETYQDGGFADESPEACADEEMLCWED